MTLDGQWKSNTDHLGSTVLVTDENGDTVWSSEYTPFGQITMEEGILTKAAKFTGKDLDKDTGLYYFNARWYDAELGRFISEDPVADPNNTNLYTYCTNKPLRFVDLTGLAYEDFEKEAKTSIWSKIGTAVKNFFSGKGYKTDSQINIENRNKLASGVGNNSTVASAQASLVMMDFDLGKGHGKMELMVILVVRQKKH